MVFNNAIFSQCKSQKHLGIILDSKLTLEDHYKTVLSKKNITIGLLRKLQNLLPREALITIYKAFVRPHLDYGDVLFDQAFNASFHEKLESIQYNACLALTGTIRGTSKEKLYQELGLESLQLRRWYRKLCLFYKIFKNKSPAYLFNLIPARINPIGIKYITKIRLGLSHLREHKFKHSFQDSINPICDCGNDVESEIHFFLHCPLYSNERCTLLNSLSKIDHKLLDSTNTSIIQILLFGNSSFTANDNTKIISLTTDFVLSTKRFDGPLL